MTVYDVDQRNNLAARWGFSWRGHGSLVLYRLEPQPAVIGSFQIGSDGVRARVFASLYLVDARSC
jgi:hypothetical protein